MKWADIVVGVLAAIDRFLRFPHCGASETQTQSEFLRRPDRVETARVFFCLDAKTAHLNDCKIGATLSPTGHGGEVMRWILLPMLMWSLVANAASVREQPVSKIDPEIFAAAQREAFVDVAVVLTPDRQPHLSAGAVDIP